MNAFHVVPNTRPNVGASDRPLTTAVRIGSRNAVPHSGQNRAAARLTVPHVGHVGNTSIAMDMVTSYE